MGEMTDAQVVSTAPSYDANRQAPLTQTTGGRLRTETSLDTTSQAALANAPGIYRRTGALGAAGDGVAVVTANAGTVTLTFTGGGTLQVNVGVGTTVFPFSVSAMSVGTATGATAAALFFT